MSADEKYARTARSIFVSLSVTGSAGVRYDGPEEREAYRAAIAAEAQRRGIPVTFEDDGVDLLSVEYADEDDEEE